jgi:hypothetical protein
MKVSSNAQQAPTATDAKGAINIAFARMSGHGIESRLSTRDWTQTAAHPDAHGFAMLDGILSVEECDDIRSLYGDDSYFRSRVVMARHGFDGAWNDEAEFLSALTEAANGE